jgi:hypothetical protein
MQTYTGPERSLFCDTSTSSLYVTHAKIPAWELLYGSRTSQHVSILRPRNKNGDVSGPMLINIFYFFMITQYIHKIMKSNFESLCISIMYLCFHKVVDQVFFSVSLVYLTMLFLWLSSVQWRGYKWIMNWKDVKGRGLLFKYYPKTCYMVWF